MQNQEHGSSESEMQYLHPETVQSCSMKWSSELLRKVSASTPRGMNKQVFVQKHR